MSIEQIRNWYNLVGEEHTQIGYLTKQMTHLNLFDADTLMRQLDIRRSGMNLVVSCAGAIDKNVDECFGMYCAKILAEPRAKGFQFLEYLAGDSTPTRSFVSELRVESYQDMQHLVLSHGLYAGGWIEAAQFKRS